QPDARRNRFWPTRPQPDLPAFLVEPDKLRVAEGFQPKQQQEPGQLVRRLDTEFAQPVCHAAATYPRDPAARRAPRPGSSGALKLERCAADTSHWDGDAAQTAGGETAIRDHAPGVAAAPESAHSG